MKRLIVASLACVALASGSAVAADMAVKAPILKAPPPMVSWTGCYIAGGVGYGLWNQDHSNTNTSITPATGLTTTDGGRGWLGRAGAGCDYQVSSSFVIGAFGDYDFMSLTGSNSPSLLFPFPGGTTPLTANMKETGAWAAGGRIGYLVTPSLMSYVSGGYTQARFTQTNEFSTLTGAPISFAFPNYTANGWFLGGGTEYAVPFAGFRGLFWRTEYRYSSYRSASLAEASTITGLPSGNVENTKANVQTVTSSLVWRFNWGGM